MRVALFAYACRPGVGSERGAGWDFTVAAAAHHETWLFTRATNVEHIEKELAERPLPNLRIVPVDLPAGLRRWKKGERFLYPYYLLWQAAAWRAARARHRVAPFDVAHHATFALDWLPAAACFLPGVPSVWGPVGGATMPTATLVRTLDRRAAAGEVGRVAATSIGRVLGGSVTARRATLVVANNSDVARRYRRSGPVVITQHAAVDDSLLDRLHGSGPRPASSGGTARRAVFVGRLLPWKGTHLALDALARAAAADWSLDIFGEGPAKADLERRAGALGLGDRVRFNGRVPRARVLDELAVADCLVLPSFHDSAPFVIAEAITLGCPVVCLDLGGPADMVGAGEGVRVPPHGDVVTGIEQALAGLPVRGDGTTRWSAARFGPLVDEWYAAVGDRHAKAVRRGD